MISVKKWTKPIFREQDVTRLRGRGLRGVCGTPAKGCRVRSKPRMGEGKGDVRRSAVDDRAIVRNLCPTEQVPG